MRSSHTHYTEPEDSGAYILLLYLKGSKRIEIGSLGRVEFPEGYYAYAGSAMNGLRARVGRHLIKEKTFHWHIDYLVQYTRVMKVFLYFSHKRTECEIVQRLAELPGAAFPVKGFGSSDCVMGCVSHLVYFPHFPSRN